MLLYCKPCGIPIVQRSVKSLEITNDVVFLPMVGDVLSFKRLSRFLGITSHDFKRNAGGHSEFIETIADAEWGRGMYHTGFAAVA